MAAPKRTGKTTARVKIKVPLARRDPKGAGAPNKRTAHYIGETEKNLGRY